MATAPNTVQNAFQIASTLAPTGPATETDNYLQRRVQWLDGKVAAEHASKALLWSVASKAILVGFTVLAVGTCGAVSFLAPVYLPLVCIALLALRIPAFKFHESFSLFSVQAQQWADRLRKINEEHKHFVNADVSAIQNKLTEIGVFKSVNSDQDHLEGLKYALAQHQYLKTQQSHYEEQMRNKEMRADTWQLIRTDSSRQKARSLRSEAIDAESRAFLFRLEAAFLRAVIQRPAYAGEFDDELIRLNATAAEDHLLAAHCGKNTIVNVIEFVSPSIPAVTFQELHNDRNGNDNRLDSQLTTHFTTAIDAALKITDSIRDLLASSPPPLPQWLLDRR